MLTISTKQLERLGASREQEFSNELVAHGAAFFPESLLLSGPEALQHTALFAIATGRQHRLRTRRSLFLYFNCMLMLGSGVLTDPWYPWAATLLRAHPNPEEGIEAVSDKALALVNDAWGPEQAQLKRIAKALAAADPDLLRQLQAGSMEAFPQFFERFFPSKYSAIGGEDFMQGLRAARRQALSFGLRDESDAVPYIFATLILGSGLGDDPLFPGLRAALNDKSMPPGRKTERIFGVLTDFGTAFSQ